MRKIIFPFLMMIFLAGCVSNYMPPVPQQGDPAATKLAESAAAVSRSILTLEGIRKAEKPDYAKKLPSYNIAGLMNLASVDWTGPIAPLVLKIAQAGNYQLRVLGNPPPIPIIIRINVQSQPLAEILRNADYQAGCKADIVVYKKMHVIELRYAPPNEYICPSKGISKRVIKTIDYSKYVK